MNKRQCVHYECGGMNEGFAPFLPYEAKNGITFTPKFLSSSKDLRVLFFYTTHGVISPACGVCWDEDQNSDNRYTKAVRYQPLAGRGAGGFLEFEEYGREALDEIAGMVAEVHLEMAAKLTAELKV
jgi:hypothetical protein